MNLIATLIGWGVPAKLAKPLLYGIAALLLIGAIFAAVKLHDRRVISDHQTQVEKRAAPATDQAATERANDTIVNAKHEEELHNVIAAQPDQPISPTSHALACERLRRVGKHPPACR